MAKTTGMGGDLYAGGYHIGGDIQSYTINGGNTPIDVTDLTQSAHSRLGGVRTGSIKVVSYHDTAAGQEHAVFSLLPTTDQIVSVLVGQALGNAVASCNAKQIDYNPTRGTDGSLTFAVDAAESNSFGLEWGIQLTASPRTDTTATTGAFYDQLAGNTFGAQGYLQLVSLTGTNVDVSVTHSTTSGGAYTTIMDFGSLTTAPQAVRAVSSSQTINEFLKVVTTGTFTNAVFFVAWTLNTLAVTF